MERFLGGDGEDPYALHADLQRTMQRHVGIYREEAELNTAIEAIEALKRRAASVRVRDSERRYNPGWHLCRDVQNLLVCAEAIARAALLRTESRGAHSRLDFPAPDEEWSRANIVVRRSGGEMVVATRPVVGAPDLEPLVADRRAREGV
jgi:succinate dehydrogenase / fumarate reductase flavoprotein subunit